MPAKKTGRSTPQETYWEARLRSRPFRHALNDLVVRELRALARVKLRDVVDLGAVRKAIGEIRSDLVAPDVVAEAILRGNRHLGERLQRHGSSLLGVFDAEIAADVEALIEEDVDLSGQVEGFVSQIMEQEFVLRLFTDILFTSISSFYKKVNPLFGALTVRMLEDQIKGFIRFFLPMVQRQAIGFALDRDNQQVLVELTRAVFRQILNEPLQNYAGMVSPRQARKSESLLRKAVANPGIEALFREVALRTWEDFYAAMSGRTLGTILGLADHAEWLAEQAVGALLPALARPEVVRFVTAELASAPAAATPARTGAAAKPAKRAAPRRKS